MSPWVPGGSGAEGAIPGVWEPIRAGSSAQGCQAGGAEPGWLRRRRMPRETGSATPASRHPAVPPRHLCNELAGLSPGQGWEWTQRCRLGGEGRLSRPLPQPPLAVEPRRGGMGAPMVAFGLTPATSLLPLSQPVGCWGGAAPPWGQEGMTQHHALPMGSSTSPCWGGTKSTSPGNLLCP